MDRLVIDGWGKFIGTDHEQIIVKEKKDGVNTVIHRCIPQYRAFDTPAGAALAKEFINAKLHNMSATLGTLSKSRKDTFPDSAEALKIARDAVNVWIDKLEKLNIKDKSCGDMRETIMGYEGNASASYWKSILAIIPDEFGFKDRSGRYAADPVNAMLNYGYGVLEGECWRAVHYSSLDPYGGFLHVDRPGKASLVYDIMEEFRQQIVDKSVIKIFSLGQVKPDEFTIENGICKMADGARKLLFKLFLY